MKKISKNEREQELNWDNRKLGAQEEFVRKVSPEREAKIDEALGLHSISIRLQREIIEQLKVLAREEGLGYQPLIRQILTRYVREKKVRKVS